MFAAWGRVVVRRRWLVLIAGLVFMAVAGGWGTSVFGALVGGGFDDPRSESAVASHLVVSQLGRTSTDLVVLFRNPSVTVDDPAYRTTVEAAVATLPKDIGVLAVNTYWTTKSSSLVSADKHSTFAAVTLHNADDPIASSAFTRLRSSVAGTGYTVKIGGGAAINSDINGRVSADIARAEGLSLPILMVLLVVVFGSLAAAALPLAIGGLAILGSFLALKVISLVTDVSIFSVNIVTIMGLGLAIDYGLFMVSRFREEIAGGVTPEHAVVRTLATAGRTVAVSAVTVAASLAGLLVFLRSMSFGGIAAVLVAAAAALSVMPALLAVLGRRVDALSVRALSGRLTSRRRRYGGRHSRSQLVEHGFWYRLATSVMRRPVVYMVVILAALAVLAWPFLHVTFGGIDARVLPSSAESRQVSDQLRTDFPSSNDAPITSVLTLADPVGSAAGQAAIASYVKAASALSGAHDVAVSGAKNSTAAVAIGYPGQALDPDAKRVLREVRHLSRPAGVSAVHVGGFTAIIDDQLRGLGRRLPIMGGVVAATTFVLLFLAFGSILLPIKAILMNVLSLGASFGAITWVFQDGHLASWLHFTPTGTLEATQPILVLAIVFGLSMDYEVFLLSRIREQYDITGDNRQAVATGLQRTGRIITSAALLLMVVIGAFSTSSISFIKLIGVAMLIAIAVDATLVRSILVPATMRLLGNANWWAPKPLRRLYARYGVREGDGPEASSSTGPAGLTPNVDPTDREPATVS
jgi:RND superfamily putative drug exporter